MTSWIRMVLSDLAYHAEATVVTGLLSSLIAGSVAFLLIAAGAIDHAVVVGGQRLGADFAVVTGGGGEGLRESLVGGLPPTATFADPAREISDVPGVDAVSSQLFVASAQASCCDEGDVLIVGFDPGSDFVVTPWIGQGQMPRGDQAAAGAALRRAVGLPLKLFGRRLVVSGSLARTGWGYYDRAAFVPLSTARSIAAESLIRDDVVDVPVPDGDVSVVFVRASDPAKAAESIRVRFPGLDVVSLGGINAAVRESADHARLYIVIIAALAAITGICLLALASISGVSRRGRDLALLRAVGVGPRGMFMLVLAQTGVIAVPTTLVGAASGGGAAVLLADRFVYSAGIPFGLPPVGELTGFVLVAAVVATAAALCGASASAWRAARFDPYVGMSR